MLETSLFYLCALGALISALGVVLSRSAVYCVLWQVACMCFTAALYVLLKAFLVAAVQVLVYAGAILVLFLFIVMLMDKSQTNASEDAPGPARLLAAGTAALLAAGLFKAIQQLDLPPSEGIHGTPEAVGKLLFSRYALPFELTALLVLGAIVSIVVLAKKDRA